MIEKNLDEHMVKFTIWLPETANQKLIEVGKREGRSKKKQAERFILDALENNG